MKKDIILSPTLSIRFVGQWGVKTMPKPQMDTFKIAMEMGVKFAVGSDSYTESQTPFGKFGAMEVERLVSILGFRPMDAIVSATKIGAEALGIADKVGTIEKGKLADILLVEGDPLENIGPPGARVNSNS